MSKITKILPLKNIKNFYKSLPDGEVIERKSLIADFNNNESGILAIISKPVVDHDQDIIWPLGISDKYYKENPVVQWNHDISAPSIGVVEKYEISKEGVIGTFRFSETLAFATDIKNLIMEKIIKSVSIGYVPISVLKAGTDAFKRFANEHNLNVEGCKRIITTCEWLETSIVPIGACPDALILAAKSFTSDITTKAFKLDDSKIEDLPNETEIPEEIKQDNTDMPEGCAVEDPNALSKAATDVQVAQDVVNNTNDIPVDSVDTPVIKPLVIKVIRTGGLKVTEEIKAKALRFLSGKSI